MSNPFLREEYGRDVETAILLEKATIHDIGNAVAYTNEAKEIFVNTEDNLRKILPDYNEGMLKWLLWHEYYHGLLFHANRFFKYIRELAEKEMLDKFHVTKDEVNIIMDILVHDIMAPKFPELVETAKKNLAQFRNRNSLKYTFTTHTLEEMIDEYAKTKSPEDSEGEGGKGTPDDSEDTEDTDNTEDTDSTEDTTEMRKDESKTGRKGNKSGGGEDKSTKPTDAKREEESDTPSGKDEHDEADWEKLKDIDNEEFIDSEQTRDLKKEVQKLKQRKINLGRLAKRLNGLATTTKERTYSRPSYIDVGNDIILKGKRPGKTQLYLIFDASGSMGQELATFKKLITEAIPQALDCPCEWFSGYGRYEKLRALAHEYTYHSRNYDDYYKGKFRDMIDAGVYATGGYSDDGDRTIELCLKAEQAGYTPIGVTDGGYELRYKDTLKQLKKTILIGHRVSWDGKYSWLEYCKEINPNIQIQEI